MWPARMKKNLLGSGFQPPPPPFKQYECLQAFYQGFFFLRVCLFDIFDFLVIIRGSECVTCGQDQTPVCVKTENILFLKHKQPR